MLTQSSPSLPTLVYVLPRAPATCRTSTDRIRSRCRKMLLQEAQSYIMLKQQFGGACQHLPTNNYGTTSMCALLSASRLLVRSAERPATRLPPDSRCEESKHCKTPSVEPCRHPRSKMCICNTWVGFLVGLWYARTIYSAGTCPTKVSWAGLCYTSWGSEPTCLTGSKNLASRLDEMHLSLMSTALKHPAFGVIATLLMHLVKYHNVSVSSLS